MAQLLCVTRRHYVNVQVTGTYLTARPRETYVDEGIDALALFTPLIERRRQLVLGVLLLSGATAAFAALQPTRYRAEMILTPVTNNRSPQALSGIAALAGATFATGYQLTPARMVELLTSRAVLSGVGLSRMGASSRERVIDRSVGKPAKIEDFEQVSRHLRKRTTVAANKETGTVTVSVVHRDSALARVIASRVVDSASQIFVRTSRSQAQQLRMAQDARVSNAAAQLAATENRLREFNFRNRAAPNYSEAGLERERLIREIRFAEQVYTQAVTERDAAFARELEATPTVVVQDPLPPVLPKVRKRVAAKTVVVAIASFALLSLYFLLVDVTRRRLARRDEESLRFSQAVAPLSRLLPSRRQTS